ncbi:MAG TPA: hypothetical protein VFF18_00625 [Woeseiaceae bacterium]|nr:hypothetical protein [Woeseiaceae bacterium]
MRTVTVAAAAALLAAMPAAAEHTEIIELELEAEGLDRLEIETGAGPMEITGVAETDRIRVRAEIHFPDAEADEAAEILAEQLRLTLERGVLAAELVAELRQIGWSTFWGERPTLSVDVRVPERFAVEVEDGSGSLAISDVRGDVDVEDGSGSLVLTRVGGTVEIDDGSGSLAVQNVGGDVVIEDGSGSLSVRDVAGSVTVDDGSGGITVTGVAGDLTVLDAGSGSLRFDDIGGEVDVRD